MNTEDTNRIVEELKSLNRNLTKLVLIEKIKMTKGEKKKQLMEFLDNIQ